MQTSVSKTTTNGVVKPLRIGAMQARPRLSKLLDRVDKGQWIILDRAGRSIGVIVPIDELRQNWKSATERIKEAQEVRFDLP